MVVIFVMVGGGLQGGVAVLVLWLCSRALSGGVVTGSGSGCESSPVEPNQKTCVYLWTRDRNEDLNT